MKRKIKIGLKIRCGRIQTEGRWIIHFKIKWNRRRKYRKAYDFWVSKDFSLGLSRYRLWYPFQHPTGKKAYDYSPYFTVKTVLWKKEESELF